MRTWNCLFDDSKDGQDLKFVIGFALMPPRIKPTGQSHNGNDLIFLGETVEEGHDKLLS